MKTNTGTFLFITLVTFVLWNRNAIAQQKDNTCVNTLFNANKDYEAGNFAKSIELLKPCLPKLSGIEVFEAYRLLALCYLNLHDEKNANEAAVNLLRNNPDYQNFPYFDPLDFTKLLARYDVWSRLDIGVKAGINFNSVNPIKNYSVTGSGATFLPGTGYQVGITAEYFLMKNISVNADIFYEGLSYSRNSDNVSGWSQSFSEKLQYISIPVSGRYYFYKWKGISFAAELGLQTQVLSATNSNIELTSNTNGDNVQSTLNQSGQRNKVLFYGIAGLAIKYKLGGGNLCANVRYAYGLSNVVNADKRYDNLDFILSNQYVDSDISFNPLYLSLGYQFPIPNMYAVKLRK